MASHPLFRTRTLAACSVFGACTNPSALAAPPALDASVAAHAGHVVVAGRAYGDLDAAARAPQTSGTQAVRIDTCMPGAARALRAVAYRLRGHALYPRVLQVDEPACASAAAAMVPASARAGGIVGVDEAAVDRYWDGLMP